MSDWFYCLLLSIGSSTDNLSVGFSMGLSSSSYNQYRDYHPHQNSLLSKQICVNGLISICNALGAFLSSFLGNEIILFGSGKDGNSHIMATVAPFLAAMAFFYLAYDDIVLKPPSNHQKTNENITIDPYDSKNVNAAWKLAVPMTLNNLAGGVAGGSAGISPMRNGMAALFASFAMMQIGWTMGSKLRTKFVIQDQTNQSKQKQNHIKIMGRKWNSLRIEFISASIFTILGMIQLFECYSNFFHDK